LPRTVPNAIVNLLLKAYDFQASSCISVLFRGRGMKRCLAEGRERFQLWVAAAVLANNLMKIAALLTHRSLRKRKAT
jgi:hypothetical protein